jgi:hypothetical protein
MTTAICVSMIRTLAEAMASRPWKVALIKATAQNRFDASTANYSSLGPDEVVGAGYVKGGALLSNARVEEREGRVCLNFDAYRWRDCDIACKAALLYTADDGTAGAVLDFGGVYAASGGHPFYLPFDCPIRL